MKFKNSLVGRKITFAIYSLDFREYLIFKNEEKLKKLIDDRSCFADKRKSSSQLKSLSDISHNKLIKHYFEYALFGGYPAVVMLREHAQKRKYLEDIYNSYIRKDINAIFSLENITAFNRIVKFLSLNIGNLINVQEISKIEEKGTVLFILYIEEWRKEHPEFIGGENSAKALLEKIKTEKGSLQVKTERKQKNSQRC